MADRRGEPTVADRDAGVLLRDGDFTPAHSDRRHRTFELERAITDYIHISNRDARRFIWTKTADEILASVARFCQRISDSGH